MYKKEAIKIIKTIGKEKGLELTNENVDLILKTFEEAFEKIFENLDANEYCNLGFIKLQNKVYKALKRTARFSEDNIIEWEKPERLVPTIKMQKTYIKKNTRTK